MGMTLSSIHVFTTEPIIGVEYFVSLSDSWQTYMPPELPEDLFEYRKFAKRISNITDAPVLWFYVFDDEAIWFEFYQKGKRISAYSSEELTGTKKLYGIPSLIGYEDGQKRRLSRILACADVEFQIELLEEYFGVCLLVCPEFQDEPKETFRRERCDVKYQELLAEEKEITGKKARIKAELVFEEKGKIFYHKFADCGNTYKPQHYYFGYKSWASILVNGNLKPVRFAGDQLLTISQKEFDAAASVPKMFEHEDERFTYEFFPVNKVSFTEKAPQGLRGKTLKMPKGYYFQWFDHKGRAILSDEKGGLIIVDDSLKAIAKIRLKGSPVDYVDGYILTAGSRSFFEYCHYPTDAIRIYKLIDLDEQ
jgi:hypothetical protein